MDTLSTNIAHSVYNVESGFFFMDLSKKNLTKEEAMKKMEESANPVAGLISFEEAQKAIEFEMNKLTPEEKLKRKNKAFENLREQFAKIKVDIKNPFLLKTFGTRR